MPRRGSGAMRALVVCCLLVVSLAGCSEDPQPLVAEPPEEPTVVTDPADYSYNTTGRHLHDYWGGQDRLEVFSRTVGLGAIQGTDFNDVAVRGDTDQVVPQGTRWVNVTLDWELAEPATHGATELWLRTARETEPFLVGPVSDGDTLSFESANGHNDLPHQRLSAWVFLLRFHSDGNGFVVTQGSLTVTVQAARGVEIPVYPGHPDQWGGATELPLLAFQGDEGFAAGPLVVAGQEAGRWCLSGCLGQHRPDDGAIVPYDAAVVEVVLRETSGTGAALLPGLAFHGADTLAWTRLEPDEEAGAERTYRIPVGEGQGDSAYAQQSLWEFRVVIDEPQPDGVFAGAYDLEARVLRTA